MGTYTSIGYYSPLSIADGSIGFNCFLKNDGSNWVHYGNDPGGVYSAKLTFEGEDNYFAFSFANDINDNTTNIPGFNNKSSISIAPGRMGIGMYSGWSVADGAALHLSGGGLNIQEIDEDNGIYSTPLEASLHIKNSYGGYDRLTQIQPSKINKPALNIMGSRDASNNLLWWSWGVLSSGIWAFQPSNNFGGSTGLFITRNGNLLINKTTQTNSTYTLDVSGKIRANEVTVNTTGADFVFEPTYKLRTLADVETYIKQNKHLPDVAPATEMQTNGVSMGEMQAKLLQKLEELTLYVIEQNKKLLEQEKSNSELTEKLTEQEKNFSVHANLNMKLQKEIDELNRLLSTKLK